MMKLDIDTKELATVNPRETATEAAATKLLPSDGRSLDAKTSRDGRGPVALVAGRVQHLRIVCPQASAGADADAVIGVVNHGHVACQEFAIYCDNLTVQSQDMVRCGLQLVVLPSNVFGVPASATTFKVNPEAGFRHFL